MNLTIDIGNSFIKYAIFKENKLLKDWRTDKLLVRDIKILHAKYPFENVILSTTRKKEPRCSSYLKKHWKYIFLDHKTKLPFQNTYKTPKTIGKDRLAAVAGAQLKFPKKNCLVVDIGTCMTADLITKDGRFLGGNISPGKDLRIKSMHDYTAALPIVRPKVNDDILGLSTTQALQNGALWGLIFEIEGFVKRLTREFGLINVILTGGDAIRFGDFIECKKFVEPKLVLIGLNAILEYNEANHI